MEKTFLRLTQLVVAKDVLFGLSEDGNVYELRRGPGAKDVWVPVNMEVSIPSKEIDPLATEQPSLRHPVILEDYK